MSNTTNHPGTPRADRDCRVLKLPVGPESSFVAVSVFKGPRLEALAYYDRLREDGEEAGVAVCVVDGMGAPIYACS